MINAYLNFLEGAVEHGNEHIQQDNHHDDVVHPIQNIASVLDELMVDINDHGLHFWQAEDGPKQCFEALLQPGGMGRW